MGQDWLDKTLKFMGPARYELQDKGFIAKVKGHVVDSLKQVLQQVYSQMMRKIKFELSPKPSKAETAAVGKTGFVPVVAR